MSSSCGDLRPLPALITHGAFSAVNMIELPETAQFEKS
jgi:hypothetical protein